tara:strand:- start:143 stop:931 length:789 start_codon:yes stop_codon:yes gene_type:complete
MEQVPLYTIPKIDLSAKSLLMLAQFGFFCVFAYWGYEDAETTTDWIFPVIMILGGASLYLSVPNSRIGVTLGIPAVMVLMSVIEGEPEMAGWAIFFALVAGSLAYLPVLAMADDSLGLDEETSRMRFGILYSVFALFMIMLFSILMPSAMDGEFTDEDTGGDDITYALESTEQTIAQAGLAFGVIGILIFIGSALLGVEIGPLRPWHGGALLSGAVFVDSYLWYTIADSGVGDIFFALAAGGIFTLSACIAYEGGHPSDESE